MQKSEGSLDYVSTGKSSSTGENCDVAVERTQISDDMTQDEKWRKMADVLCVRAEG